ncbi:hypothetical protein TYRP_003969 [Tyrophagus putrescentiae]|nr:hypothetical protein TYRP_003969 [Tyrophagus putrescentiae]
MATNNKDGAVAFLKNVYNDPFMWNLVKSWAFFAGGIFVARELMDFDTSVPASM